MENGGWKIEKCQTNALHVLLASDANVLYYYFLLSIYYLLGNRSPGIQFKQGS